MFQSIADSHIREGKRDGRTIPTLNVHDDMKLLSNSPVTPGSSVREHQEFNETQKGPDQDHPSPESLNKPSMQILSTRSFSAEESTSKMDVPFGHRYKKTNNSAISLGSTRFSSSIHGHSTSKAQEESQADDPYPCGMDMKKKNSERKRTRTRAITGHLFEP